MRALFLALGIIVSMSTARAQDAGPVDYLVLVPRALRAAVEPLAAHRAAEGLRVRVVEVEDALNPKATWRDRQAALRAVVRTAQPRFLLIAGDVDTIPSFEVAEVATDRPYGDHDDDGLPEVSIGRLPASDAATMSRMVGRTIAYEAAREAGAWQKQCALVAGEGRFGPAVDAMIENLFQRIVAKQIPAQFDVDLTYANPRSAYCYPFEQFADRVVGRLNDGALVMAYVGHGDVRSVDDLTAPGADGRMKRFPVLDASHVPNIRASAPPIMVAIACWTGQYEGEERCIGEELLATGRGPVAFFGSSRISHPVPNALLGISLIGALFEDAAGGSDGADRLGPRLDRARRALVTKATDPLRTEILMMANAFVDPDELRAELPRHVDMYNLLGDPALHLARPGPLALEARVVDGVVQVSGSAPGARGVTLTLETPRDRPPGAPVAGETPIERYARANDRVLATTLVRVGPDGAFSATLPLPASTKGGVHVAKAFATGDGVVAAGAAMVTLEATAVAPAVAPAPAPATHPFH